MDNYLEKLRENYRDYLKNKDVKKLEKQIYQTDDDKKKVEIELKRIDKFLRENINYFKKYSYKYYLVETKFNQYMQNPTDDLLHEIMEDIVSLELLCGMKIALLQVLHDDTYYNQISMKKK